MTAVRRLADPATAFPAKLIALGGLAFAARVAYGFAVDEPFGDATFYHEVANRLAGGAGYQDPYLGGPTAAHPPLFPLLLSVVSFVGLTTKDAHQAAGCALGGLTVVLIGFAGRRLGGARVGLVAAAVAAVYLPLIANDSLLYSESAYGACIALVILVALWAWERPTGRRALALGVATGLAALGRGEALLLVPLLAAPLALRGPDRSWQRGALLCLGAVLVVLPWTARNWTAFDRPVLISTNEASVLGGANCDSTYGRLLGQWDIGCLRKVGPDANEAVVAERWRNDGLRYAREHASEVPKVVAARVGRTWSIYGVRDQVELNSFLRGSPRWLEWLTVASFAAAVALAVAGAALVWRGGGGPLWILLAPVVVVTITSAIGYGTPRFRQAAEIPIMLLAAVALSAAMDALARRRGRPAERPKDVMLTGSL